MKETDSRSDYQKGRDAIEVLTKDIKEHSEQKGREMTHDQAERKAREVAERVERKQSR